MNGAANANAVPNPGAPPKPVEQFPNRFEVESQKQLQKPFGISGPQILKLHSDGNNDWPRKIKMAIMREYFTLGQYLGGVLLGWGTGILTMFLLAYLLLDLDVKFFNTGHDLAVWGCFLLMFGLFEALARVESRRPLVCDPYSKYVDKKKRGRPCVGPQDCTVTTRIMGGTCIHRPLGGVVGTLRYVVPSIALVAGVALMIIGFGSESKPGPKLYSPALILGAASGVCWGYVFS